MRWGSTRENKTMLEWENEREREREREREAERDMARGGRRHG